MQLLKTPIAINFSLDKAKLTIIALALALLTSSYGNYKQYKEVSRWKANYKWLVDMNHDEMKHLTKMWMDAQNRDIKCMKEQSDLIIQMLGQR